MLLIYPRTHSKQKIRPTQMWNSKLQLEREEAISKLNNYRYFSGNITGENIHGKPLMKIQRLKQNTTTCWLIEHNNKN